MAGRKRHQSKQTLVLAALAVLATSASSSAQDNFYKGKLVTVLIGEVTGGALDAYARVLATGLNRHLPGNPTVIVQSMPGAATVVSMNYLARRAPHDGTQVLMALSTAPFAGMFGIDAATYKATDLTWIGNFDQGTDTCSVWKGSGIESFDDLRTKPAIFGAVAPSGIASEYPRSMNALLGTNIKVIHGYGGTAGIMLAMQRGEVQGSCAFMVSALNSSFRTDYNAGRVVPIIQFARKSNEIKDVPYMLDLAKTEEEKQLFNVLYTRDVMARSIAAPPDLPPERTAMLRAAFDASVKDPDIIEILNKAGLPLLPMGGQEVEDFVKSYVSVSPEVLTKARAILDAGATDATSSIPKK